MMMMMMTMWCDVWRQCSDGRQWLLPCILLTATKSLSSRLYRAQPSRPTIMALFVYERDSLRLSPLPSPPLDNIRVMAIVWRLRGNIIRTAVCWIVWHNVHSQQHTYMSSSYMSNRLGLSHWAPGLCCAHRGGRLELYYCNMVEWFWWDSSLISRPTGFLKCFDTVGLGG